MTIPPGIASFWHTFAATQSEDPTPRFYEAFHFDEVTAEFAATEGEGDGSLEYWQRAHRAYFGRECRRIGRIPTPTMPVICERFEVVFRGPLVTGD